MRYFSEIEKFLGENPTELEKLYPNGVSELRRFVSAGKEFLETKRVFEEVLGIGLVVQFTGRHTNLFVNLTPVVSFSSGFSVNANADSEKSGVLAFSERTETILKKFFKYTGSDYFPMSFNTVSYCHDRQFAVTVPRFSSLPELKMLLSVNGIDCDSEFFRLCGGGDDGFVLVPREEFLKYPNVFTRVPERDSSEGGVKEKLMQFMEFFERHGGEGSVPREVLFSMNKLFETALS
jgi:hypothetical protein